MIFLIKNLVFSNIGFEPSKGGHGQNKVFQPETPPESSSHTQHFFTRGELMDN